jgi:hypothetical protein
MTKKSHNFGVWMIFVTTRMRLHFVKDCSAGGAALNRVKSTLMKRRRSYHATQPDSISRRLLFQTGIQFTSQRRRRPPQHALCVCESGGGVLRCEVDAMLCALRAAAARRTGAAAAVGQASAAASAAACSRGLFLLFTPSVACGRVGRVTWCGARGNCPRLASSTSSPHHLQ